MSPTSCQLLYPAGGERMTGPNRCQARDVRRIKSDKVRGGEGLGWAFGGGIEGVIRGARLRRGFAADPDAAASPPHPAVHWPQIPGTSTDHRLTKK